MPRFSFASHLTKFRFTTLMLAIALLPGFCRGALVWESQRVNIEGKSNSGVLAAQFHFKNTGDTTITITEIKASCGCTTTELTKRTYTPGEEGSIKALMAVGIRAGVQEKSILVTTDDAPGKPVTLWLRVNIQQLLTFSSEMLFWRANEGLMEKSVDIGVASPLRLESLAVDRPISPDGVESRIEVIEAGTHYRIFIRPSSIAKVTTTAIPCLAKFVDGTSQAFTVFALVR